MSPREDGFCGLFPRRTPCAGWESTSAWDLSRKESPPPRYETSAKISGRRRRSKLMKTCNMRRKKRVSSPMKRPRAPCGMPMERKTTSSNITNSSSHWRKRNMDRRLRMAQRKSYVRSTETARPSKSQSTYYFLFARKNSARKVTKTSRYSKNANLFNTSETSVSTTFSRRGAIVSKECTLSLEPALPTRNFRHQYYIERTPRLCRGRKRWRTFKYSL